MKEITGIYGEADSSMPFADQAKSKDWSPLALALGNGKLKVV
jgi:hypothetical protein